jgi:DNA polymerase-3 subunit delta'
MIWPRVIGQRRVKEMLLAAIRTSRLPHAYLFYGGEGVGKDAMALELARVVNCDRHGEEACGECPSCAQMASLQHPAVRFLTPLPAGKGETSEDDPLAKLPEADVHALQEQLRLKAQNPYHTIRLPRANVIKISSVREVRRESSFSTEEGKRRIFIISQAEAMEAPAANTLLKTLEEPPGDTMLILTTAHREALLPTILSRCQSIRFDPLTEQEIAGALVERNNVPAEQASTIARLASGNYTKAVELLDDDVMELRKDVVDFIRKALSRNVVDIVEAVEKIAGTRDRDVAVRFLNLMLLWFRDALVLSHGGAVINEDQQSDLQRFVTNFPRADLLGVMADVEKAISLVGRYAYIRLVFFRLVVRLRGAIVPGAAAHATPVPVSRKTV